jgi:hypothetical protein
MLPAGEQGRPAHGSIPCRVRSEYRVCSRRRLWRSDCSLRLFGFLGPAAADLRRTDRRGSFQRPSRVRPLPIAGGCPKLFPEPLQPGAPPCALGDQRALLLCQSRIDVQHEWVDIGTKLGNNERYAMHHKPADEVDVPRKPVQLRDRDRGRYHAVWMTKYRHPYWAGTLGNDAENCCVRRPARMRS